MSVRPSQAAWQSARFRSNESSHPSSKNSFSFRALPYLQAVRQSSASGDVTGSGAGAA